MKLYFSPHTFHTIAKHIANFRWRLLLWSAALLSFFVILQTQITSSTPDLLILVSLLILFSGLQALVIGAFIFFFLHLPSKNQARKEVNTNKQACYWLKFYQTIEWCEATLFFVLLPLPCLTFVYAVYVVLLN